MTTVTLKSRQADEKQDEYSSEMLSETSQLALASIDSINVNDVFNTHLLLKRAVMAGLLIFSVILFGVSNTPMTRLALKRLYMLSPEKWERNTQIELVGINVIRDNFNGLRLYSSSVLFVNIIYYVCPAFCSFTSRSCQNNCRCKLYYDNYICNRHVLHVFRPGPVRQDDGRPSMHVRRQG